MIIWGNGIIERYREKHDYVQFILYSFLSLTRMARGAYAVGKKSFKGTGIFSCEVDTVKTRKKKFSESG